MEKTIINVEGMSCEHCEKAVTNAVAALDGVDSVKVSLEENTVTVEYDEAQVSVDEMKAEIEELGYDVV